MKRVLTALCALVLSLGLASMALAQAPADTPAEKGEKGFKRLDANGDGKVTKEEFLAAAQKQAEARFAKLDAQNKGYLTKEDFMAAREKAQARKAKRQADKPAL
jgi:Ca2+-binding EF-hand superfamily protein